MAVVFDCPLGRDHRPRASSSSITVSELHFAAVSALVLGRLSDQQRVGLLKAGTLSTFSPRLSTSLAALT
jgi:hypothetical protein